MQVKQDNLNKILERHKQLEGLLVDNEVISDMGKFIKLSKEFADISPVAEEIKQYNGALKIIAENLSITEDPDMDKEIKELAKEELLETKKSIKEIENNICIALLPKDSDDKMNIIMEIRPAAGGDEAALFVGDLYRMYEMYADKQNWKMNIISTDPCEIGGYKEIILEVIGTNVFANLKFESGVHRVQRVPTTETSGRLHTSTITVAVLPEPEEVDIKIDTKDLRIDIFRASGPGGQSVNTTDSAVRITHIPSGLVVSQQDEKSQHKNKAKAMKILGTRLYEMERQKKASERSNMRKQMIGTGDRSERIRTYNFPQSRVTDHRILHQNFNIDKIINGDLHDLIGILTSNHQAELMNSIDEVSD